MAAAYKKSVNVALVIQRQMSEVQVYSVLTEMRDSNPSTKVETELFEQTISWLTSEEIRLKSFGGLLNFFNPSNIHVEVMAKHFYQKSALMTQHGTKLWFTKPMETFQSFLLNIPIHAEGSQVRKTLEQLRRFNPSKKVETFIFRQLMDWLTYDQTRLQQFAFLLQHFKPSNIDSQVLITMFRSTTILTHNEFAFLWYKAALETKCMGLIPPQDIEQFNEGLKREIENIRRTFGAPATNGVPGYMADS